MPVSGEGICPVSVATLMASVIAAGAPSRYGAKPARIATCSAPNAGAAHSAAHAAAPAAVLRHTPIGGGYAFLHQGIQASGACLVVSDPDSHHARRRDTCRGRSVVYLRGEDGEVDTQLLL